MIKNVTRDDVALLELLEDGSTDAPGDVLQSLKAAGHVLLKNGTKLTASGRARAELLKPHSHDIRQAFSGRMTTTAKRPGMVIGGGSARIHG